MGVCIVVASLLIVIAASIRTTSGKAIPACEDLAGEAFLMNQSEKCFLAAKESLWNSFSSHLIMVNCTQCAIIHGETAEDVQRTRSFLNMFFSESLTFIFGKDTSKNFTSLRLSPYLNRHIKVKISRREIVKMRLKMALDFSCLACFVSGTLLFFSARNLSNSVKFYYTSGVAVGVLASLLVIVFILSRFVPKKPAAYSVLIGGWTLGTYLMRLVWNNLQLVIAEHYTVFIGYIAISGFLSFALCYWKGPVTNPKTQHIIQWSIQLFAIFLLYSSSQSRLVSIGLVTSVVFGNYLSMKPDFGIMLSLSSFIRRYIWRPKLPKLLTEEEYRIQAEVETRKALEELREYCNSPECSPWKTMSRIKSPVRFASFVEGGKHVSDAEMTLHDTEPSNSDDGNDSSLITDDESEDLHKGDNGTARPPKFQADPNISEDED